MKKFLLAMMAIFALVAANPGSASAANVQLKTSLNSWGDGGKFAMTETSSGSGVYSCRLENAEKDMQFVIMVDNIDYKSKDSELQMVDLNNAYAAATNVGDGYNHNFQLNVSGDLTFTYTLATHTIVVTKTNESGDQGEPENYTYSLRLKAPNPDNNNNWEFSYYPMTMDRDGMWVVTATFSKCNVAVLEMDGEDTVATYTVSSTDLSTALSMSTTTGDGLYFDKENNTYKFTFDAVNKKLTISVYEGGDEEGDPTPDTRDMYYKSSRLDWGSVKMTPGADYTWTYIVNGSDEFVIVADNTDELKHNAATVTVVLDQAYTLYPGQGDNHNFKINGSDTYIVTVDASDKNNLTVTVTVEGDDDEEAEWSTEKFVYFNAGFDWERESRINGRKLFAHFIKKGSYEPVPGKYRVEMLDNRNKEENVNAMLPLFYAPVPENYDDFWGVQFEVEDGSLVYNTTKPNDLAKYDWENGHWFQFIFGCEKAISTEGGVTVCRAEQSYVTYAQYRARRDDPNKEAIYYLGNNLKGRDALNESTEWFDISWDGKVGSSQRSEDVFMFQVMPQNTDEEVKFKMSWIDATGRMNKYNAGSGDYADFKNGASAVTGCDQRWWVSFNLGLVGPTISPIYGNDLNAAKDAGDYVSSDDPEDNGKMAYKPNRCRKYSRYNMYDWWIKPEDIKAGNYYVVVDTYYQTTALVEFEPKPIMTLETVQGETYTANDAEKEAFGNMLAGSEKHGAAIIDQVNVINGKGKITVSDGINTMWSKDYTVDYGIYYDEVSQTLGTEDSNKLLTHFAGIEEATNYTVSFENLPYGETFKVGVRCTYTDTDNEKIAAENGLGEYDAKFRSFTNWTQTLDTSNILPEPEITENANGQSAFQAYGWHAHINATFNANQAENGIKAFYLDIDPEANSNSFHFAEASEFAVAAEIGKGHYTKSDFGDSYTHEANNWAYAGENGTREINFVIEDIEDPSINAYQDKELWFTLQCPFLIGDLTPEVKYTKAGSDEQFDLPTDVRRAAAPLSEDEISDIVLAPIPVQFKTTLGAALSGINDAAVDNGGDAEYFNLQGVRVQGDIVPGIYLMRKGDQVSKVVVK